jgi:predicted nucleic acid-binding protein
VTALVVDASVAVKWLVPESHADAALRALRRTYSLLAPDLIWPEVGNALWKKSQRGELTAHRLVELFQDLGRAPMEIFPTRTLAAAAMMLGLRYNRTFYDSLYLALAHQRRCSFVTADRRLYNALAATPLGERLLWVEELT